MTPRRKSSEGQSLVETILLLPLVLVLLAGGYWSFRNLDLSGSAESAAHAHMLRTGRNLPPICSQLSGTIVPNDNAVTFRGENGSLASRMPPFRGMSGRTIASTEISLSREPVGAFIDLPSHAVRREAEGAVDCWGRNTKSGSTIRGTVKGIVASGAFR